LVRKDVEAEFGDKFEVISHNIPGKTKTRTLPQLTDLKLPSGRTINDELARICMEAVVAKLTNAMNESSREPNSRKDSQEIPRPLWKGRFTAIATGSYPQPDISSPPSPSQFPQN
jgi:hypothetical protein